jgi:sugar transferase (PEP-CTERM/EpsH1 system associated)
MPRLVTDVRPPLVLHVIHHLVTGGMENGLVNLINHMSARSFRHAIACIEDFSPEFRQRIERTGVEVFPLHRSRVGVWKLRRRLYQLCRSLRPAILHSRNQSGLDALLPARLAGVRCCVHGEHGWDVDNLTGEKWKPILRRRLHALLVDRYIAVSKDLERYLAARIGVSPAKITQIYNGVNTELFVPAGERSLALAPSGFLAQNSLVIGTVGRLQPVKDQATLVKAVAYLVQAHPALRARLRLVIVGNGPLLDDLRALAAALGIAEQCWFPGSRTDVRALLRLFDVFVLPSLNEGISNTILEAMASGLPLLATNVGGNVELVEENESGRFFVPGDAMGLASLLADYTLAPDLARRHGQASREIAMRRFGLRAMVTSYQKVYEDLIYKDPSRQ